MTLKEQRASLLAKMKEIDNSAKDRIMTEEERTEFSKTENEIRELDAKIEAEERNLKINGFSTNLPAQKSSDENQANERAANFVASGKTEMRAILSSGTIAKPTNVGTDIAGLGEVGNSIVDDVRAIATSGTGAWVEPYKKTDSSAKDVTDGSEIGGTGATFGYVTISPKEWGVLDEISNQVRKMTPVNYESAIQQSALIALREKAADCIIKAIAASSLKQEISTYKLDATFIRSLVLGFRSIAGKGNVKLYISQEDLATLGAVRGTNEKKPVYEIEFDAGTTTSGTIKDGGTAVQFRVLDGLKKGTQYFGQPQTVVMPMWDNYQISTDQGGDYFKRNVMGIRGIQTANVDLCALHGMQVIKQEDSSSSSGTSSDSGKA